MASTEIPDLTAASALTGAEIVPITQGGLTRRTTAQAIANLGGAGSYQPLDSDLTAIAALTTTAYGRAFLELADAAAARAALALGTAATTAASAYEVAGAAAAAQAASQPVDSDLTAIAALTTTAYGRAFLALADAAALKTLILAALGLTGFTVGASSITLTAAGGSNEIPIG